MSNHVHDTAKLGAGCQLGLNIIIEQDVQLGQGCVIGHNVVIYAGTKIGNNVRIDANSVIGKMPLRSPRSAIKAATNLPPAVIGDDCLIGAGAIIYAGCQLGVKNLVADLATIRENVTIGDFNIIGRGAAIENYCQIGSRNKLETNSYLTAYSTVGDYCFIAPGVITSNDNYMARDPERYKHFKGVTIKTGGRIGAGAVILPGKTIFGDGVAAAGTVVTRDIPEGEIHLGNPSHPHTRPVPQAQLLKNNLDKQ